MKLAINSIVFVAAVVLAGCEKKVEAPVVVDAGTAEKPACCETASAPVDADAGVPVAPLTAPAVAPPVAAPTTTIAK